MNKSFSVNITMDGTNETTHGEESRTNQLQEVPSPAPVPVHNLSVNNGNDTTTGELLGSTDNYQTAGVVEAEELGKEVQNIVEDIINCHKNKMKCEMDGESSIKVSFIDNENMIKYSKKISSTDKDWTDNKKYFHEDFTLFYNALKTTFNQSNPDMRWSNIEKTETYMVINVVYEDNLFGYDFTIAIMREENQINILEKNQDELKAELDEQHKVLIELEEKVEALTQILNYSLSISRHGNEGEMEWSEFKRNNGWSI